MHSPALPAAVRMQLPLSFPTGFLLAESKTGLAKARTSPAESSSLAGPMWRTTSVSACSIRLIVVVLESSPQPATKKPVAQRTATSGRTCLALIVSPSPRGRTGRSVQVSPPGWPRVNGRRGQPGPSGEDKAAQPARAFTPLGDFGHE